MYLSVSWICVLVSESLSPEEVYAFEELMSKDTKRAFDMDVNFGITRKGIEESDIPEILEKDLIAEKIDLILWSMTYCC